MLSVSLGEGSELRSMEPWQAVEFAEYVDRVRDHIAPRLPWVHSVVDTASARRFLQEMADSQARDGARLYGIYLEGKLVGGTCFRLFDAASGLCELGVWLGLDVEGRGLATQAARTMIDWAVEKRGMHRIQWLMAPDNAASAAVAQRLGMSYEGTMRGYIPQRTGGHQDLEIWSVLARDWVSPLKV
ncbi:GNAT family N-acetyltransferase [Streptomyces sp. ISL-112]|uniref:GNAT family N-acetyltransferase n=1 Tax=unclassified Streptomyces TaxID=2593676 RepID=UPI001BEC0587|nr:MULTISPECIES: GNAT family protein [unclassified Streptomyces]MBT2430365.1 GNAT family N-acetyltransferase [Streptomyces sp. ISL-112]MBT2466006.1 GNAT family N-acetyltransferase [Streptomyces sp. ISL-63]